MLFIIECPKGTYGLNCSRRCPTNMYGNLCAKICNCNGSQVCNHVDGCIGISYILFLLF